MVNGSAEEGFRAKLLRKFQSVVASHNMVEDNLTPEEIRECSRFVSKIDFNWSHWYHAVFRAPYFYVLAIMCHSSTDLIDRSNGVPVEQLMNTVLSTTEACVIHAWMLDLWDVTNKDSKAWSKQTFKNLISFVERDRQVLTSEANQQVRVTHRMANLMRVMLRFTNCLSFCVSSSCAPLYA